MSGDEEVELPIAEIFDSIQGEGRFCGTPMTFVRFAGCNVGKPYTPDARHALGLKIYQERCTTWAGDGFPCDTNYKVSARMDVAAIMHAVQDAERVCITGGEPLIHDLTPLLAELNGAKKKVHIETSGTKVLDQLYKLIWRYQPYVACSPKHNFFPTVLHQADEIKILVDAHLDEPRFIATFHDFIEVGKVWIQPVNEEETINQTNLQKCLELQRKYRKLNLSLQLHKILGVR